jgi:TRAP-type C4-dicarboxylate transport system permease small subunit
MIPSRAAETMPVSRLDTTRHIILTALAAIVTVACAMIAQQVGDQAMHSGFSWMKNVLGLPELSEITIWILLLGTAMSLTYCLYGIFVIRRERNMLHAMALKTAGHQAVQGRQN